MSQLPPGKYYWPSAESHESYTNTPPPTIKHSSKYTKYPLHTQIITSSESHSELPMNQKYLKVKEVKQAQQVKNILPKKCVVS